jgi:hypothetical protein
MPGGGATGPRKWSPTLEWKSSRTSASAFPPPFSSFSHRHDIRQRRKSLPTVIHGPMTLPLPIDPEFRTFLTMSDRALFHMQIFHVATRHRGSFFVPMRKTFVPALGADWSTVGATTFNAYLRAALDAADAAGDLWNYLLDVHDGRNAKPPIDTDNRQRFRHRMARIRNHCARYNDGHAHAVVRCFASPLLHRAVAAAADVAPETVRFLAGHDSKRGRPSVLAALSSNPALSDAARREVIAEIRRRVRRARNQRSPSPVLGSLLRSLCRVIQRGASPAAKDLATVVTLRREVILRADPELNAEFERVVACIAAESWKRIGASAALGLLVSADLALREFGFAYIANAGLPNLLPDQTALTEFDDLPF